MSEYLTQKIAIGDTLHLQWPVWHLVDGWESTNYLLVSVGSGLSPMLGLYESIVAKQQDATKVAMLYGERYLNQVLPSTLELFSKNLENAMCQLYLSREDNDFSEKDSIKRPVSIKGYVQSGLDEALEFLGWKDISVFICGKPEMVDDVKKILMEKGIAGEMIKFEKY
jgi:NAD(P)H-flavin reductase